MSHHLRKSTGKSSEPPLEPGVLDTAMAVSQDPELTPRREQNFRVYILARHCRPCVTTIGISELLCGEVEGCCNTRVIGSPIRHRLTAIGEGQYSGEDVQPTCSACMTTISERHAHVDLWHPRQAAARPTWCH